MWDGDLTLRTMLTFIGPGRTVDMRRSLGSYARPTNGYGIDMFVDAGYRAPAEPESGQDPLTLPWPLVSDQH